MKKTGKEAATEPRVYPQCELHRLVASARKKTKLKDVHSIFQEQKQLSKGGTIDAERTEPILQEFVGQADGNTARIFVDKPRAATVVFQTAGMRRLFSAFPEIGMVDRRVQALQSCCTRMLREEYMGFATPYQSCQHQYVDEQKVISTNECLAYFVNA
ncbi:hypothetical protein ON010_g11286 [Phytophthora cinnamomi]|nr:hypothetical protein ON010_g11286 [Phytophthora cinnamomi]